MRIPSIRPSQRTARGKIFTHILEPELIHMRKHLASLWLFSALSLAFAAGSANATPQVVDDGLVIEDVTLISPNVRRPCRISLW